MSASYICASCRHQLFRRTASVSKRNGPSFASYITLSGRPSKPSPEKSTTHNENQEPVQEAEDEQDDFFVRSPEERGLLQHLSQQKSRGSDQALESLFQDFNARSGNTTPVPVPTAQQETSSTTGSTTQTRIPKAIDDIGKKLDDTTVPLEEIWKIIETIILPSAKFRSTKYAVRASSDVFGKLMTRTVTAWCQAQSSNTTTDLPSPSQLRDKYWSLNIMFSQRVQELILSLLRFIVMKGNDTPQWSNTAEGERVINSLLDVWKDIFKRHVSDQGLTSTRDGWLNLASLRKIFESPPWSSTDPFRDRFSKYLGRPPMRRNELTPIGALLSLYVLGRRLNLDSFESTKVKEFPFLVIVSSMAFHAPERYLPQSLKQDLEEIFDPQFAQTCADALVELNPIVGRLRNLTTALLERKNQTNDPNIPTSTSEVAKVRWFKRIARVEEAKDGARLRRLWVEAQAEFSTSRTSALSMPPEVFEFFLRMAFKTRQHGLLSEIWQSTMASFGRITRTMTWNTLLQIQQQRRDISALEQTWRAMLSNGAQPNAISWAIRIHSMLDARQLEAALAMLSEMDKTWLNAAIQRKGLPTDPRKNGLKAADLRAIREEPLDLPVARVETSVINVMLSSLLRRRRIPRRIEIGAQVPPPQEDSTIKRLLDWAAVRGIQPNTDTYNLFIGDALRFENRQEVSRILTTMEQRGIQPDSYTFSHLLNARFRSSETEDSEETLAASVSKFLSNMEQIGMKINSHHYTILVDGLLKRHNNPRAAQAVLAFMKAKGMQATPYVYTTMANWYFNQDPPALDAVVALCESMKFGDHLGNVSAIFYTRVIQGYADVDDIENMMTMFSQLEKDSKTPTWRLLECVIEKLVDIGQRDTAQRIVDDIGTRSGPMKVGIYGRRSHMKRFQNRMMTLGFDLDERVLEEYDTESTTGPWDGAETLDANDYSNLPSSQSAPVDDLDMQLQNFPSADNQGQQDTETGAEQSIAS